MADLFQILQKYKNNKIAIYGLGTETEKVLKEWDGKCQVIGLLDGYRETGTCYDMPVISLQEAVAAGVRLILVAARPGSCRAIARRIGKICRENRIDLIDIRGNDLCRKKEAVYRFAGLQGMTRGQLLQTVSAYEAVSIDLFDTLIMRQTLFPADVFEIVDARLQEKGILIEDFCGKRLESEKFLSRTAAPMLKEIYAYLTDTYSVLEISAEELAELEWTVDEGLAVPREEMCSLLSEIYRQGKEVFIVSDTYYTKAQIEKLLDGCGITCYTDIFASCEYGTGKVQKLFRILKDRIGEQKCVHIGDDILADVESAEKNGIASCQVYSGLELLEMAGYLGLWDSMEGLADRIRIGMFVSRLFNSPFQFETEEKKISVKSSRHIGWLFLAPMITDFVLWFDEQVKEKGLDNVWFSARDGYLIKKLYDELNGDTSSVYFLTSRTAAVRAGLEREEDIRYIEEMKFSGTLAEQMAERFGIYVSEERTGKEKAGTLLAYSREILDRAAENREHYRAYLEKLNVKAGGIAFFDFVAKGTSQMYLERLVPNPFQGLYFLWMEEEYMRGKGLDILPFYKAEERDGSAIFDNYYILETILTSPMPSVKEFDKEGRPCYGRESRKDEDIACCLRVQEGILDYFRTYLKICPEGKESRNKKLDELFLSLIHKIDILDRDFIELKVEDPFFNRTTDITDLL